MVEESSAFVLWKWPGILYHSLSARRDPSSSGQSTIRAASLLPPTCNLTIQGLVYPAKLMFRCRPSIFALSPCKWVTPTALGLWAERRIKLHMNKQYLLGSESRSKSHGLLYRSSAIFPISPAFHCLSLAPASEESLSLSLYPSSPFIQSLFFLECTGRWVTTIKIHHQKTTFKAEKGAPWNKPGTSTEER